MTFNNLVHQESCYTFGADYWDLEILYNDEQKEWEIHALLIVNTVLLIICIFFKSFFFCSPVLYSPQILQCAQI